MPDQKVTIMMLKVDLQCSRCYKKIKRVLCKFPQIRDQVFVEKTNTIVITVVCCSPEKIKQKIICKAGDTLESIEIKEPEKPKPKQKDKPREPKEDPPKPAPAPAPARPKPAPAPAQPKPKLRPVPTCHSPPRFGMCCNDCHQGNPGGPCYRGYGRPPPEIVLAPPPPKSKPQPVPMCYQPPVFGTCCSDCYQGNHGGPCYRGYGGPPPQLVPPPPPPPPKLKPQLVPVCNLPPAFGTCCSDCYQGNRGGPCYRGYGRPPPQCYQYNSNCGRSVYDSYGGETYSTNENPGACSMM